MSNLKKLSEELIEIINSNDDTLNNASDFLKKHNKEAREIISTIGKEKITPLMQACSSSQENIVKLLLSYKPDTNFSCNFYKPAIYCSIQRETVYESDLSIIRMLVENGAYLNDYKYDTPLATAIKYSIGHRLNSADLRYKMIELLLQLGSDVNKLSEDDGNTPLIIVAKDKAELIPLLIKYADHVDGRSKFGTTALMYCARFNFEMVDHFIDANANVFIIDTFRDTAINYDLYRQKFHSNTIPSKLKLERAYLEPLSSYFENSSCDKIRKDISEFLSNICNDDEKELFPIRQCHIAAIDSTNYKILDSSDTLFHAKNQEYLCYFGSADFQEKIYADVINRIDKDQAEIDGQTLRGMRARAKNEQEMRKINHIEKILREKSSLAYEFLRSFEYILRHFE